MGVKNLMQLILTHCARAVRKKPMDHYGGKIIACDAMMAIYQFLLSINYNSNFRPNMSLSDENGNPTAHLLGIFNRTCQLMENGIKPVWVFDGTPPDIKG
jgi:flap endonuclease-1